jgi:hypothetical protein
VAASPGDEVSSISAQAQRAEPGIDRVEQHPQQVGRVDHQGVALDPDRAVRIVEPNQRRVGGDDHLLARLVEARALEGSPDAWLEAADDRVVSGVRRLAGDWSEDQPGPLVGIDQRVEQHRSELLGKGVLGLGRVEGSVDDLGEGLLIEDAALGPGRGVRGGDRRDEQQHEQCREKGSEHRRSLAARLGAGCDALGEALPGRIARRPPLRDVTLASVRIDQRLLDRSVCIGRREEDPAVVRRPLEWAVQTARAKDGK